MDVSHIWKPVISILPHKCQKANAHVSHEKGEFSDIFSNYKKLNQLIFTLK